MGFGHKRGSHRIFENVSPLLLVTLVASQNVVEESALPDGIGCRGANNCLGENLFQNSDPSSQFEIVRTGHEEVDVIGHDHVTANGNVAFGVRVVSEFEQNGVDRIGGQ